MEKDAPPNSRTSKHIYKLFITNHPFQYTSSKLVF
jgi:hypothetical protein